jgi:PKD repeat protein
MKKIFTIILVLFAFTSVDAQQQLAGCCPKFSLLADFQPCDRNKTCEQGGAVGNGTSDPNGGSRDLIIACKNQTHRYLAVPNMTGYSYVWTIVGTPTSFIGNPAIITWGNSNQGFIQVIITSADGSCRDTIKKKVCLIDGPIAGFTFSPNPVCFGSPVCFSSAPSLGASGYYWDFGDGTYSNVQNPCHTYASPGNYNVVLTVSGSTIDSMGNFTDCGCRDTAKAMVVVSNKKGIEISTTDCRKMLCAGDTVKYCTTTTGCSGLTWVVNGGTIYSGQGTTCVTVIWNQPSTYPTSVTLNASCPGTCGNTATLNVPVLYPNLPIQGPNIVCPGASATYSLPALPGTFYHWSLSGGGNIAGYDSNHNVINVIWNSSPGGMYILTCNYNNPYTGCSGTDTIGVYIKPTFKLTGPSPVCTNQTVFYSANGPATGWTFSPATGFTNTPIGPNQQQINWSSPGNYTITTYPAIPTNYCTPSASISVVVNPTPVLSPIVGSNIVCPSQLYNYSVSSNIAGGSFNWIFTLGTGNIAPYGLWQQCCFCKLYRQRTLDFTGIPDR